MCEVIVFDYTPAGQSVEGRKRIARKGVRYVE